MPETRERPILMSGPMVVATLEDRKTKTRRVIKIRRRDVLLAGSVPRVDADGVPYLLCNLIGDIGVERLYCPYGQVGERLWVRETWKSWPSTAGAELRGPNGDGAIYRATWDKSGGRHWKASIHMPRWASRLLLEIVSVQAEQLQQISADDIEAEGIPMNPMRQASYRNDGYQRVEDFKWMWNEINPRYPWSSNPWVWVIEYRRVR